MINVRSLIKLMSSSHVFFYRLTGGIIGGKIMRAPVLLLTTTGRKTGKERTTPVLYMQDGKDYVVVASNAGDDNHPAWYLNMQSNPRVQIQVRSQRIQVRAETASPEQKARLWPKLVEMYPDFESYTKRTSREIPVVLLHPEPAA